MVGISAVTSRLIDYEFLSLNLLNLNIDCAKKIACETLHEPEYWCRSALPVSDHKAAAYTHASTCTSSNWEL